jgi:hypothetical protein
MIGSHGITRTPKIRPRMWKRYNYQAKQERPLFTLSSAQSYSLTEQMHAVPTRSKRPMVFSAFIALRNPVGTLIAILQIE